ncbi:MAG: CDP-alcohol phosphatidyltransferase family protein [Bradymonadia bacterium]
MWNRLVDVYRSSVKPQDTIFNTYLARPLATPFVLVFERIGISPNQVTLVGLLLMLLSAIIWCGPAFDVVFYSPSFHLYLGLILLELAYVLDCVDGQLARRLSLSSDLGASLDFLMDELKAFLMIGSLCVFWWSSDRSSNVALFWGVSGVICVASAISLTRFIRSDAMQRSGIVAVSEHGDSAKTRARKGPFWWLLLPARLITQYPQSLPFFILFNRVEWFVMLYSALHFVYAFGRLGQIFIRLFRRAPIS